MRYKKLLLTLSSTVFGLAIAYSASAATYFCPTDNGFGVGCTNNTHFCGGSCRSMLTCPSWQNNPICASGQPCTNCTAADACGICSACQTGKVLCGTYPNMTCTTDMPANCNNYNCSAGYCVGCNSGYTLCSTNHTCVPTQTCSFPYQTWDPCSGACTGSPNTLRLNYDSVNASNYIIQSSNPALAIPSSGNVGIGGTTTPVEKLTVTGGAIYLADFTPSVTSNRLYSIGSSLYWNGSQVGYGSGGGLWNLSGNNLYASNTAWNVGIGTSSPFTKLHIYDASSGPLISLSGLNSNFRGLAIRNTANAEQWFLGNNASNNLVFRRTGSFDYMTILAGNGNIGIGVANPVERLEVSGNVAIKNNGYLKVEGSSSEAYILADYSIGQSGIYDTFFNQIAVSENNNFFYGNAILTLSNNGLVGINETAPSSAQLVINSGVGYAIDAGNNLIRMNAVPIVNADVVNLGYLKDALQNATSSITNLWGGTTGGNIWNLNTLGNVGIGTASPQARLTINTNATTSALALTTAATSATSPLFSSFIPIGTTGNSLYSFWTYGENDSNGGAPQGSITNYVLERSGGSYVAPVNFTGWNWVVYDGSAYQNRLAIKPSGYIGIGSTLPGYRLEINGTTSALSLKSSELASCNYSLGKIVTADTTGRLTCVNSSNSSGQFVAVTATTYNGNRGGYAAANALCNAAYSGSHVCMTGEIINTINNGNSSSIPVGTFWIANGPPAYTANANDCMGYTSSASTDFGQVWFKGASSSDGYGSLNYCNGPERQFACCK